MRVSLWAYIHRYAVPQASGTLLTFLQFSPLFPCSSGNINFTELSSQSLIYSATAKLLSGTSSESFISAIMLLKTKLLLNLLLNKLYGVSAVLLPFNPLNMVSFSPLKIL